MFKGFEKLFFIWGILKFVMPHLGGVLYCGGHLEGLFDLETHVFQFWEMVLFLLQFPSSYFSVSLISLYRITISWQLDFLDQFSFLSFFNYCYF